MYKWSGFKKAFQRSRFLTLMVSMMHEVTVDSTPPAMSVQVTTDKPSYEPGDEVIVRLLLSDFASGDPGYSYLNFIVQYDSEIFDNAEYLEQSAYKDAAFTAGHEVSNMFQYNFINPVDGGISFGLSTSMRGIDIQVEAKHKQSIPAVDQTLATLKLRVKDSVQNASSVIGLAGEFTRIRTAENGNSVYLYSPDIAEIPAGPVTITSACTVPAYISEGSPSRLA
ncbi:cohesin domain-containing protein [Paenibacillus tepidiphilus]|uniref:cohesin domain-containing protein n=1 Tax=Paenibacillus tepidiphilus TaxID=2608683 RepID=UPI0012385C01|nr:cohesin domain-containing protein [Paenibacillus tepidiphilus]